MPTQPNRTKKSTPNDVVMTSKKSAIKIINHFQPKGSILEPCRGKGSFYDNFNNIILRMRIVKVSKMLDLD